MSLNQLPKVTVISKKRMGRGLGSGKGKTGGRGQKGQKARGKIPLAAVGGGLIFYKKLPYRRGWTRSGGNPKRSLKPVLIKTADLNKFKPKSVIDIDTLVSQGLASEKELNRKGAKILSSGELKVALTVKLPVSERVKSMIEKAGGKVE